MVVVQKGTTCDLGIPYWEIRDAAGSRLTEFNHARFPQLLSGVPVYFVDLDLDPRFCENVQTCADVDGFGAAATPAGGIDDDALLALRAYIMAALLEALARQGAARKSYLAKLNSKMGSLAAAAPAPDHRVSLALLKAQGLTA